MKSITPISASAAVSFRLAFERRFGSKPRIFSAPGRVNLIGEHTDYNDGFVLPLALDRSAWLALRARDDRTVRLLAADLDDEGAFNLDDIAASGAAATGSSWLEYPKGVAWSLAQDGHDLLGFDGALSSDVPRGAGLSSSAALELAVAAAFLLTGSRTPADHGEGAPVAPPWDVRQVARAMQRTENEWIGVSSGIMDQLIGAAAVAGHATLIDCRDLSLRHVPLPAAVKVVILDTGTRRGLVASAYNDRREACERVAKELGLRALRDLSADELELATGLDPADRRRARHVIAENARTLAAAEALVRHDVVEVGRLMRASHASLRDLFEVSSTALDAMVAAAEAAPGCLGARMTGAGFGGCAVALVAEAEVDAFTAAAGAGYENDTGNRAAIYVSIAGPGASAAAQES